MTQTPDPSKASDTKVPPKTPPKSPMAADKVGRRVVALGNEAIARGAFEAGCTLGSGYPGTPSTEILESFAEIAKSSPESKIHVEWSINEKVGFEVAYAGSLCNARSMATMKHVGLNVASDSFINAAYGGAVGGFVVFSADDPSLHSSQNEQDNRFYGMQAMVPVFEPSNVQESMEMIKYAFEFSEKFKTIVLFRTNTRMNHSRGDLTLGAIDRTVRPQGFDVKQREQWMHTPANARKCRQQHLKRFTQISASADQFPFNQITIQNGAKVGIISSGVPYAHSMDALDILGITQKVSLFKLGLVYPLPKQNLIEFLRKHEKIIVIEELEPFLEHLIKNIAYDYQIPVEIHGKDLFSQAFEFYPEVIIEKIAKFFGVPNPIYKVDLTQILEAPPRPPVLCPGCTHRNAYQAEKRTERRLRVRLVHSSDIGCYTLGFYDPINGIDTCIAMGASIGLINGISKVDSRVNMAFIGDSTFFHSGLVGLMNAVANKNDILAVILDNSSTSMTGHQDHPGTGVKIDKTPGEKIQLETLIEGVGVPRTNIWVCDANNISEMEFAFEQAIKARGVRVVIPRALCALLKVEKSKKEKIPFPRYCVDNEKCCSGELCLRSLGCPAMSKKEGKITIDRTTCSGCSVCSQICPFYAVKPYESNQPDKSD